MPTLKINKKLPSLEAVQREIRKRQIIAALDECPEIFAPLRKPSRYKAIHGGRGSGKSHRMARNLIKRCLQDPTTRAACIREVQKSLKLSVRQLLVDVIKGYGADEFFEILTTEIKTPEGGLIIFQGMQDHTADSIKSLEGFDIAWVEEAQSLSAKSLKLLRPTMRKPGSELWFTWNPDQPTDPVDEFFRKAAPPQGSIVIEANYWHNPHFPDVLKDEMEYDKRRDPDKYIHVWEGGYQARSEARVFHNWEVQEFETPADARFLFGADWGFAKDPTTLVRFFIGEFDGDENPVANPEGRKLFVDYETVKVGCPIDKTPELFRDVPESDKWPIRADSARPETIDYMQRHGFPKMVKSIKGKGSIVEGVEFIKNYDVVIHPRCKHTEREFIHFSYKVDPKTDEILPELKDDENHIIDPIRYGLELIRRAEKRAKSVSTFGASLVSA